MSGISYVRASPIRRGGDGSRQRSHFAGMPRNWVSIGTVGYAETTPAFVRIEDGKVLVEVTLQPSGQEIVAELMDPGGGGGFALYMPVRLGMRVVVAWPNGTSDGPIIVGKLTDAEWPLDQSAAGVSSSLGVPQFAYLKTPEGTILSIETGNGGDIVIRSGASVRVSCSATEQILLDGPTHLGGKFATSPVGAGTGLGGEIVDGAQGGAFFPIPYAPIPYAPGAQPPITPNHPRDGIVRAGDKIGSDIAVDPVFWAWIIGVHAIVTAAAAFLTIPFTVPIPTGLGSHHKTASKTHTAGP